MVIMMVIVMAKKMSVMLLGNDVSEMENPQLRTFDQPPELGLRHWYLKLRISSPTSPPSEGGIRMEI